jgi:hypothetical protein
MRRDARTCAVRWGLSGFYAGRQGCGRCVYLNEQGRAGQGSGMSTFSREACLERCRYLNSVLRRTWPAQSSDRQRRGAELYAGDRAGATCEIVRPLSSGG